MSQTPEFTLTMTESHHTQLQDHLFPGDGLEAVAVALCGRREGTARHRLLVQELFLVPHDSCRERTRTQVTWPTDLIEPTLEDAEARGLSVVKIHSHPTGQRSFSVADDRSDGDLFPCLTGWLSSQLVCGSAVMLPGGELFGRARRLDDPKWQEISTFSVVGPDLRYWRRESTSSSDPSEWQVFGEGTARLLRSLSIAVVGCSGTGSPVVEQLARLGVGTLVLVDDDRVEERNLGRILNSTKEDVRAERCKVDLLAEAVDRMGLGTRVVPIASNLWDRRAVDAVGECDVVFGCMDTHEGRFLLNLLSSSYLQPYFDIGVRLDATGCSGGAIREACGSVHYLLPGQSSLMSRGLVSLERVRAEGLRRLDPAAFDAQVAEGYILGVDEQKPAVISLNMFAASLAVNDLLARIHPYREDPNLEVGQIEFSLASLEMFTEPEGASCPLAGDCLGQGDMEPRLGLVELS